MPSFWSSKAAGGRCGSPVCPTALTRDPSRAIIRNTNTHSTGFMQHLSQDCLACLIVFHSLCAISGNFPKTETVQRTKCLTLVTGVKLFSTVNLSRCTSKKFRFCLSRQPSTPLRKNHKGDLLHN